MRLSRDFRSNTGHDRSSSPGPRAAAPFLVLPLLALSDLTLFHFSRFPPSLTASPGFSSSFAAPSLLCPSVAFLLHLSLQEVASASSSIPLEFLTPFVTCTEVILFSGSGFRVSGSPIWALIRVTYFLSIRVSSAPILSHNKLMI